MEEKFALRSGNFYAVFPTKHTSYLAWTELPKNATLFNDYDSVVEAIKTVSIDYCGSYFSIEKFFIKH